MVKEFIPEVRNYYYDSTFQIKKQIREINLPMVIQFIMDYSPNLNIGDMRSQVLRS